MRKPSFGNKGQAIMEMAIFGSLFLFLFSIFLSYSQRLNDQQYVQMETFRRTLEKACTAKGASSLGAGYSVQMTDLQQRHNVDASEGFRKGSTSTVSASSSVFWAVPQVGRQAEDMLVFRINDAESANLGSGNKINDINISSNTSYNEVMGKQESPASIATSETAKQSDTVTTALVGEDGSIIWQVAQGLYKDSAGQYGYSSAAAGNTVEESRKWETSFAK